MCHLAHLYIFLLRPEEVERISLYGDATKRKNEHRRPSREKKFPEIQVLT